MMKVGILSDTSPIGLENSINEFIKVNEVMEIQFSTSSLVVGADKEVVFAALIVYKEKKDV